jgi:phosphatidylserine/phosphatidylglycerophosphate/cardiolipin synthase-like enzyme
MKRITVTALTAFLVNCSTIPAPSESDQLAGKPMWEVYFSPKGGCEEHVIKMIRDAKKTIRVQAYSFTSKPITAALIEKSKTIDVKIILDRSDEQGISELKTLINAGVSVSIDAKHSIAHNKVIVVDNLKVETGSFNFTNQAEKSNAENCLFISNAGLAQTYGENWDNHQAHSRPPM